MNIITIIKTNRNKLIMSYLNNTSTTWTKSDESLSPPTSYYLHMLLHYAHPRPISSSLGINPKNLTHPSNDHIPYESRQLLHDRITSYMVILHGHALSQQMHDHSLHSLG
jgi:hypothetical protein